MLAYVHPIKIHINNSNHTFENKYIIFLIKCYFFNNKMLLLTLKIDLFK